MFKKKKALKFFLVNKKDFFLKKKRKIIKVLYEKSYFTKNEYFQICPTRTKPVTFYGKVKA